MMEAKVPDAGAFNGHVVLIAYYYPPLVGPGSARAASFCSHLARLGWEPIVVTPRNGFYYRARGGDEPAARVIRTRSIELSPMFRKGYSVVTHAAAPSDAAGVRPVKTGELGATARRLVRELIYVPDSHVGWVPFAARAADEALRSSARPQVIFSTSHPYSAHFAAMSTARRTGVPWVAEFRDPWSTDRGPDYPQLRLRQRVDRALENRILRTADHVTVVSESFRQDVLAAHPDLPVSKISVVTNGFESMPVGHPPFRNRPMRLVYVGTVHPPEDVGPILQVLDRVHARCPGSFELQVVGPTEAWRATHSGAIDRPWLALRGVVSMDAARQTVADASVLLLQRDPLFRIALPGKMFEYIGARRPILAVVPPGSEMESVLRAHADTRLVRLEDPDHFIAAVELLLEEHRSGKLQRPRVPPETTAPLHRSQQVARLAEIFANVLSPAG
jgi:glycosyltransferase involved in cell wall biosynthesis